MDCSPPGSLVLWIFQARILEQVATSYLRGLYRPGMEFMSLALAGRFLTTVPSGIQFSLVTQSCLTLWTHGLSQARIPCPSPTPGACSNSCPSSQWCHPTISSSVVPFSSHLQSFPASGSFQMNQFFTSWPKYWTFSFSISPSNEYSRLISFRIDWFDLLAVQGTIKSLLQHHNSKASVLQCWELMLSNWSNSHIHMWLLEKS